MCDPETKACFARSYSFEWILQKSGFSSDSSLRLAVQQFLWLQSSVRVVAASWIYRETLGCYHASRPEAQVIIIEEAALHRILHTSDYVLEKISLQP